MRNVRPVPVDPSHGIRGLVDPAVIAVANNKKTVSMTVFLFIPNHPG
jgi:hypothetical protein